MSQIPTSRPTNPPVNVAAPQPTTPRPMISHVPPLGSASGSHAATAAPSGGEAIPVEAPASSKIRAFAQSMGAGHHQEAWKRPTNITGNGATHVRSFHCRLATEGLEYLDKQINEWLDSHPDYEVKNVTISVGEWAGKLGKEPNLIVQVWV
jgi:hypothetical protein